MMHAARILVTGFEPNDDGLNASQVVVESLVSDAPAALESLGDRLRYSILPGNTHILTDTLVALIEEQQPDFCFLVGQAPGRSKITFERVATNLRDFMVADRAGNTESGSSILADAPDAYFSTIDASQLAQNLDSAGIPASPSNHARQSSLQPGTLRRAPPCGNEASTHESDLHAHSATAVAGQRPLGRPPDHAAHDVTRCCGAHYMLRHRHANQTLRTVMTVMQGRAMAPCVVSCGRHPRCLVQMTINTKIDPFWDDSAG